MKNTRIPVNGIQSNNNLILKTENESTLQSYLQIRPPENAYDTSPILSFTRKREIELPWDDLIGGNELIPGSISAIRTYFESSWKKKFEEITDFLEEEFVKPLETASMYATKFEDDNYWEIDTGYAIHHANSGRWYKLLTPENNLTKDDFASPAAFDSAWEEKIIGIELLFDSAEEAKTCYSSFSEVDLRPALIERKYQEYNILRSFAHDIKNDASEFTKALIANLLESSFDPDEIIRLQDKILRLEMGEYDIQKRIDKLVADATRLGYILVDGQDKTITLKDDTPKTLEKGKLYTTFERVARWTSTESRSVSYTKSTWWGGTKHGVRKEVYQQPHEEVIEDYQEVDTNSDPLQEKQTECLREGLSVFVFERRADGFVTAEGQSLTEVMQRCSFDEDFRRKCVVMLPVVEKSLTGERIISKYSIFSRPLPGISPGILPRLSLEESLTYKTVWQEVQIGELVSSINLAPGEKRDITISKVFEEETTVSRSSTSIFEITQNESTDLASEMENQSRMEGETSSQMNFDAKVSGSYGPFSAEASASGGTSHSLKEVNDTISKVAKKAAKSVSQQNKEEVSSTESSRVKVSNTDSSTSSIENINQGRTLNLMFYRLYNKYIGGLYLENLQFNIISSQEVIAGSGVYVSRSYGLQDFAKVMSELSASHLPFDLADPDNFNQAVIQAVKDVLTRDYLKEESGEEKTPASRYSKSVGMLSMPKLIATNEEEEDLDTFVKQLQAVLINEKKEPIESQKLQVVSKGLYLDAVVGAQASTEPYSEEMRIQEVRMREAEVYAKKAEGLYKEAQALHLSRLGGGSHGNAITGFLPNAQDHQLQLQLQMPLFQGNWQLRVDGTEVGKAIEAGQANLVIQLSAGDDWLEDIDLMSRVDLFEVNSQTVVKYGV